MPTYDAINGQWVNGDNTIDYRPVCQNAFPIQTTTVTGQLFPAALDLGMGHPPGRGIVAGLVVSAISGTSPTIALAVTDSDDGVTFNTLIAPAGLGVAGFVTISQVSARRFVRIRVTTGGTVFTSATFSAFLQVMHEGRGAYPVPAYGPAGSPI